MSRHGSVDFTLLHDLFADAVCTRDDLLRLGISASTMARRSRAGGGWTRVLPGVFSLSGGTPTRRQLIRAALLHSGEGAVLTGLEAARQHGVSRVPNDQRLHVLVPSNRRVAGRDFVLVERSGRPWTEVMRNGFPLVTAERAVIDAARREDRMDVVRAMMADAVQRRICSPHALAHELGNTRLGGTALARTVLAEVADGVRSAAEAWSRSLVKRSPLPAPSWNVEIRGPSGKRLAVVDAWWDEIGLAWQIDSREFHLSPADYDHTMAQHSALLAVGVPVVHTVPHRLKTEPAQVLQELLGAFHFAATHPRPPVTATLWRPV